MTQAEKDAMYERYSVSLEAARKLYRESHKMTSSSFVMISEIYVHPDNRDMMVETLTDGDEQILTSVGITLLTDDTMAIDQIAFVFGP